MNFSPTHIPEVVLIKPDVFEDQRGFFMETWQAEKFANAGIDAVFVQDNHSRSIQGSLRGLHYQIKKPQGKLVRVLSGEVYDVAVDLRKKSPYFGQWVSETLSAENRKMLWMPPGFAHGFYVISESAEFEYKSTDYYAPEFERTIRWNDLDLAIDWPILAGCSPILSVKDEQGIAFKNAECYL